MIVCTHVACGKSGYAILYAELLNMYPTVSCGTVIARLRVNDSVRLRAFGWETEILLNATVP